MNVEGIKARYREALSKRGETIKIRRYTGTGPSRPMFEVECRAVVTGYQPEEMVGGIQQADKKAIVLHEDLAGTGLSLPLTNSDFAIVKGKQHAIRVPDDATRRVAGVVIAYELQVIG